MGCTKVHFQKTKDQIPRTLKMVKRKEIKPDFLESLSGKHINEIAGNYI